jgi:hypothetical protein
MRSLTGAHSGRWALSDIRTVTAIDAFGKNEQVKKVFWTLFVAMAGLVLARVVDPVTAQNVVEVIMSIIL